MHMTDQDADRHATIYQDAAARTIQEFNGNRAAYLALVDQETRDINALPISEATKRDLIAHNANTHRLVLNSI
jgi:hypothetical protein